MKRAAILAIIILVCIIGYLSAQGMLPFVPAFGSGMEPEVHPGSLVFVQTVKTADIATGDTVICKIPPSTREYYGYPPVLVQRVIEVNNDRTGISFLLQADDAAGEPLSVRPQDIKGKVGTQLPYIGFPLTVFRSGGLTVFIFILILLSALYLFSREISAAAGRRFRAFVSPKVEENYRVDNTLANRIEATEKALVSFSGAMQEYAQHMASHTSAIKGLSEASQALKDGAAEQNRILGHMAANLVRQKKEREVARIEEVVYHFRERTREILRAKEALEKEARVQTGKNIDDTIIVIKTKTPQGCVVKPKALLERRRLYSAYSEAAD
jgi:signal peptidase I